MTSSQLQELTAQAKQASGRAYAPYSNFPVGASVLLRDGRIFSGCNVENASYGLTSCAERNAIFKAKSETDGDIEIIAVVVYTPTDDATPPCGACRQVINEFGPKAEVFAACKGIDTPTSSDPLEGLLPKAFGPKNLEDSSGSD
ncbi:MAG: cytidine deaminase [Bdellovibrionales bacterium]|nr:cytidine deaminase [Bdellovibrionales bacterium]